MTNKSILPSLRSGYRALVFGAGGGIGAAFVRALADDPRCGAVFAASRTVRAPVGRAVPLTFALEDEASLAAAVARAAEDGPLDLVIVATGLLHDAQQKPEKTWRALDGTALMRSFQVNAIGPALIAKHALDQLGRDHKAVFAALSARVSSISDNRLGGWHGYRASKAALNMLIKTCALELAVRKPRALCVGLHPGTVDTALSKPFQAGMPAQKLFSTTQSAGALLAVIDGLEPAQSGHLFAWDGQEIPF